MKQKICYRKLPVYGKIFFLILGCALLVSAQSGLRKVNDSPVQAKFVTSDIDNFWLAFDLARKETARKGKIDIYQREYFDKGSEGLKSFIQRRIQNAGNLIDKIDSMPKYYTSIRPSSLRVSKMRAAMLKSFKKIEKTYPEAVFTEMYGLTDDAPRDELSDWLKAVLKPVDEIPGIVAHELIHYQQHYASNKTLLELFKTQFFSPPCIAY